MSDEQETPEEGKKKGDCLTPSATIALLFVGAIAAAVRGLVLLWS